MADTKEIIQRIIHQNDNDAKM